MARSEVLDLGPGDRVLAGVQLAGLFAAWLLMYLPMCLWALVDFLRRTLVRES